MKTQEELLIFIQTKALCTVPPIWQIKKFLQVKSDNSVIKRLRRLVAQGLIKKVSRHYVFPQSAEDKVRAELLSVIWNSPVVSFRDDEGRTVAAMEMSQLIDIIAPKPL